MSSLGWVLIFGCLMAAGALGWTLNTLVREWREDAEEKRNG